MFANAWRNRRGSVSILAAATLPVLVGVSGLGAEYGFGVMTRVENQRVADLAAYGGAAVYVPAHATSPTTATASLNTAVSNLATLNGYASSAVVASLVTSPSGTGNNAVLVTVTTDVPRLLSRLFSSATQIQITATSYVEMVPPNTPGCVIALATGGTGVKLSGVTSVTATSCTVASNGNNPSHGSFTVPNGTTVTAPIIDYVNAIASGDRANIHAASGTPTLNAITTADPLAGNTTVSSLTGHITAVTALTSPVAPTVTAPTAPTNSGGTAVSLSYYMTSAPPLPSGCTLTGYTGGPWNISCAGAGPFNFSTFSTGPVATITTTSSSPVTVNFSGAVTGTVNFSSTAANIYNFKSGLSTTATTSFGPGTYNIGGNLATSSSGTVTFGAGTFNITGNLTTTSTTTFGNGNVTIGGNLTTNGTTTFGNATTFKVGGNITTNGATIFGTGAYTVGGAITTGGGSTTTFGVGSFTIGGATTSCSSKFSICHTGSTLTFGGPSPFVLSNGIYNTGGETMTLGSGTGSTNSFQIGASTNAAGDAIVVGGGSTMTFGDATGVGDLFQVAGNINLGGGGSCVILPGAAAHDINGNFQMAGGTILGAGIYTVKGYVGMGYGGGGAVTCGGSMTGMKGINVTLVIGGGTKVPVSSGDCNNTVFCVTGGYSNVSLTGPTATNLVVVGPTASSNSYGASFAGGASGVSLSGVFYFPYGQVSLAGGSSLGGGTSQCLELIGSQVTLTGGSAVASACTGLSGAGTTVSKIVLVQ